MHLCVEKCVCACARLSRLEILGTLELKIQAVVSHLKYVLRVKLESSGRAISSAQCLERFWLDP